MILLRDVVEIEASPEQVFDWLAHFQENYLAWHPDHVECRYLKGTSLFEEGAVLYVEEYLHGQLHKLKLSATNLIPNSRLEYRAGFGIRGAFEVKPRENSVLFVAELTLGSRFAVLGWLTDRIMRMLLPDRIAAMQQHMAEEGQNLKRMLENCPVNHDMLK